ncbi:hypothetical protein BAE44_0015867 [Dichanthelium oligosanthes]|uniref:Uncharacterized protein n=1 Tax=Dichanthelium oligosanthes TaxID=888268 RepID=A0A1E5VDJ4_9POAL|nr:hypothetical protein BAE44_0015867 [Dichanthelium oligosanthes]
MPIQEAQASYSHNLSTQADYVRISETSERQACVINVSNGTVTVLPAGVTAIKHAANDIVVKSSSLLGRVPSIGEYKVLCIHQCKRDGIVVYYHTCDGNGRWRARPDPPMCVSG